MNSIINDRKKYVSIIIVGASVQIDCQEGLIIIYSRPLEEHAIEYIPE